MKDMASGEQTERPGAEQAEILRRLRESLAAGATDGIGAELERCFATWPRSPEFRLLWLQWLEGTGQQPAFRAAARLSRTLFPHSVPVARIALRVAVEEGAFEEAADLLTGVIWPARLDAAIREACLRSFLRLNAEGDRVEAVLLRLLEIEPDCPALLIHLAGGDLRRGRFAMALERLERAEAAAPLPPGAQTLRLEALLASPERDEAFLRALERALLASPNTPRLYALKHEVHQARGEKEAARATLELACHRFPEDPSFALLALHGRLADKDAEGAGQLLRDRVWRSALPERKRREALGLVVRGWTKAETLQPFLEELLQDTPDDRFVLVKLASLATRLRQHVRSVRYLQRAEAHGPLPPEAQSMRINLLVLGGNLEGSLALAKQQLAANPDRKDLVRRVNVVASLQGSEEDVVQSLRQAITQWPTDNSILQRYNRAILPEAEDEALFEHVTRFRRANSVDGRWRYQFALACLRRNRTPEACAMLRDLARDEQVGVEARRLLGMLETLPREEWDARARFSNDATKDVRVMRAPAAKATFIVMAGVHGGLGSLPFTHLDVLLQRHPINIIYLRDNKWSAFTAGVPGLGPDEPSTIAALVALCAELGPLPVVTFGGSLGGWSALRYGALMGAQAAVSLAAPVRLAPRDPDSAPFTQHYLMHIMPEATKDLLGLLGRTPSLRIIHVYSRENARDASHAEQLAQAGHVTLMPLENCDDHFVAAHLVAAKGFHPLIEQAIALAQDAMAA